MDDAQLKTIWQNKQIYDRVVHLGKPVAMLMKYQLAKKARQFGSLGVIWDEIIPQQMRDHTSFESFTRGTLTVMVDSSAHRFQLDRLLKSGLQKEIQARFTGALNKIKLVPGQFYQLDENGNKQYRFGER